MNHSKPLFLVALAVASLLASRRPLQAAESPTTNCKTCGVEEQKAPSIVLPIGLAEKIATNRDDHDDCLTELGSENETVLTCIDRVVNSESLAPEVADKDLRSCITVLPEKARVGGYAAAIRAIAQRMSLEQAGYRVKLAFGHRLSTSELVRLQALEKYTGAPLKSRIEGMAKAVRPQADRLINAGVQIDENGPDFSKFDFKSFRTDPALRTAMTSLFGEGITDELSKLISGSKTAHAVILGKTAIIPNREGIFPKSPDGLTLMDAGAYHDRVQRNKALTARLINEYVRDVRKYSTFRSTWSRSGGGEDEKNLDVTSNAALKTYLKLKNTYGIEAEDLRAMTGAMSEAMKIGQRSVAEAVKITESLDRGFKKTAIIGATYPVALWTATRMGAGLAIQGISSGMFGLTSMFAISGVSATSKAAIQSYAGDGSPVCYLGEQMAKAIVGTADNSPYLVGFGMFGGPFTKGVTALAAKLPISALLARVVGWTVGSLPITVPAVQSALANSATGREQNKLKTSLSQNGFNRESKLAGTDAFNSYMDAAGDVFSGVVFSGLMPLHKIANLAPETVKLLKEAGASDQVDLRENAGNTKKPFYSVIELAGPQKKRFADIQATYLKDIQAVLSAMPDKSKNLQSEEDLVSFINHAENEWGLSRTEVQKMLKEEILPELKRKNCSL